MQTKMTNFEGASGKKQDDFDGKADDRPFDGAGQPMGGSPIGRDVMSAADAAMPKVTSYPY